jgi:Thiol-activated cytolysin
MKRSLNPFIAFIFCLVAALPTNAQTKPSPANHKSGPATSGATASNTTTTGTPNKSTISTAQPAGTSIDENVHRVPTKLVTMHNPAFKSTPTYARRKQAYDKNTDDTARRDIHMPDGSLIHMKMVKNPSFGNMAASIKTNTAKGSEKKTTEKNNGSQWDCTSSTVSLTANSSSFMNGNYETTAGHIYPGAIYTFDNFFNGSFKEQQGVRNPVQLVLEDANIDGSVYVNVKNPSMGTIGNGVNKLIHELKGRVSIQDFRFQTYQTGNNATQALQIGGGGSYAGFTVSASFSTSSSSNTVNMTIDAKKILYTIELGSQDSAFFVDPKIENTRNLMVMSSVSYGIRVLGNYTYTFNSSSEAAAFKASYSGFGGSASAQMNQISSNSSVSNTINYYVVGGPGNGTLAFDRKQLEKQLNQVISNATWDNVVPIEYSFSDMAGDLIGSYSSTDDLTQRQCVPNTTAAKLQSIFVTFSTGQDGKDNDTHYNISLYGGNAGTRNNYNGYDGNPPQNKDNQEPFIAMYKTGPLNVVYNTNSSNTVQMTNNAYLGGMENSGSVYKNLDLDYFNQHGGIVHLHIWPNGNDTWNIQSMTMQLNFDGGITETVNFGAFTVNQNSTEATLYFDGTFKQRGGQ